MKSQAQKLQKRCSREESMKNQFLAPLFGPRIGFWSIFGARPDPKMETFGFPAPPFFQTIFATSPKKVRTALQRPQGRARKLPGTLQGTARGPPGDPQGTILDYALIDFFRNIVSLICFINVSFCPAFSVDVLELPLNRGDRETLDK